MTMKLETLPMLLSCLALGAASVALILVSTPPPPPLLDVDAFARLGAEQMRLGQQLEQLRADFAKRSLAAQEPTPSCSKSQLIRKSLSRR